MPKQVKSRGSRRAAAYSRKACEGDNPQSAYASFSFPHPFNAPKEDLIQNLAYTEGAQRVTHAQNPATLAVGTGCGGAADQLQNHYAISRHSNPPPAFEAWDAMWNYAENQVPLAGSSIGDRYFAESLIQIRLPPTSDRWAKVGIGSFPSEEESAKRKLAGLPNLITVDDFRHGPMLFV